MLGDIKSFLLTAVLLAGLSGPSSAAGTRSTPNSGPAAGTRVQGFTFTGVTNRFLTPNGDGKNDTIRFNFQNDNDAAGTIKIYDLRGRLLTTIGVNVGDLFETWDGRANGQVVPGGVYIYVVNVENVTASGAIVVIK
jgi:gliding motility-associated-like protein